MTETYIDKINRRDFSSMSDFEKQQALRDGYIRAYITLYELGEVLEKTLSPVFLDKIIKQVNANAGRSLEQWRKNNPQCLVSAELPPMECP